MHPAYRASAFALQQIVAGAREVSRGPTCPGNSTARGRPDVASPVGRCPPRPRGAL